MRLLFSALFYDDTECPSEHSHQSSEAILNHEEFFELLHHVNKHRMKRIILFKIPFINY